MSHLRNQPYEEKDFPAFAAIREQFGFLPNFFPAQTLRPDFVVAEINLMAAILLKEGALERRQKEYIFLVCSAANLSTYCVTAHCEIVRMLGLEGPEPEQIAIDHTHAKIAVAGREMVIQLLVELLTHACWNLKSSSVPYQLHDVARSIQDGAAMSAILKVRGHAGAELSVYLTFKIIGNLTPYFYAVDFDGLVWQMSLLPFELILQTLSDALR